LNKKNLLEKNFQINAAFTHAGLTTGYRIKSLYKSIFVLSMSYEHR